MASVENYCIIGQCKEEQCNLHHYSKNEGIVQIKQLEEEEIKLLHLRIPQIQNNVDASICLYHKDRYLKYFSAHVRKCCDPWEKHLKHVCSSLREITLVFSEKIERVLKIKIIPGDKVCTNCFKELQKIITNYEEQNLCCVDPFQRHRNKICFELECLDKESLEYLELIYHNKFFVGDKVCYSCGVQLKANIFEYKNTIKATEAVNILSSENSEKSIAESSTSGTFQSSHESNFQSGSQKEMNLNTILEACHIPALKRQKLSANRLSSKGVEIMQGVLNHVSDAFEAANDVILPDFKNIQQMKDESLWFNSMLSNIQIKFNDAATTFNEKISLLSLLPHYWSFSKFKEYFKLTYYMYAEIKKFRKEGVRKRKTYVRVSDEIRKAIVDFYLDDSNSTMCSGMKECVTIKNNDGSSSTEQKKIILYDLKDLYNQWKNSTSYEKVPCLTFFAQLRPQQCRFAGEPGTHNICVCLQHQNVKLKLGGTDLSYKELIESAVCSIEDKTCMLHECSKCPHVNGILQLLKANRDDNNTTSRKYSNWVSVSVSNEKSESSCNTSRITLKNFEESEPEFSENLAKDIWDLTQHHFVSTKQKDHYAECRANLERDTGLLVIDFAENYEFICQNSTQGFYFNNASASLFTAGLYYKNSCEECIQTTGYCVLSDSMKHQAYSVNIFLKAVIDKIKAEFPWIKKLIYFSDGAPTQFKNKNHFVNLCYHQKDFGILLKCYNFFATSHGKSICDGIGAVAKRLCRKASLQNVQILTPRRMFEYLNERESEIRFCFVNEKEVEARGRELQQRFKSAKTVKNTREIHCLEPINERQMSLKLFSTDTNTRIENIQ